MVIVGVKDCGCIVAMCCDESISGKDYVNRAIGEFKDRGYEIGRVTNEQANRLPLGCACRPIIKNPNFREDFIWMKKYGWKLV